MVAEQGGQLDDVALRKPMEDRKRRLDDAVVFATAHKIRIEALSIMNDAKASPIEIARILGEDLSVVSHHIRELYGDGSIESAGTLRVRNATEHFYRAVTLPYVTSAEYAAMTSPERREVACLIVQAIVAETLAALQKGKMEMDCEPWLTWQAVPVDAEGKYEVIELMQETYDRFDAIKARNANRIALTNEPGKTEIVALMSFERSRAGRPDLGYPPLSVD